MSRTVLMAIFLCGIPLQTVQADLIFHSCYVPNQCIDNYEFSERLDVPIRAGASVETFPLSSELSSINGNSDLKTGTFTISRMFPAYNAMGRIVSFDVFTAESVTPVSLSDEVVVQPVQEICDGVPCEFFGAEGGLYVPEGLAAGNLPSGSPDPEHLEEIARIRADVEKGGSVDIGRFEWLAEYGCGSIPEFCEVTFPGFNARTSISQEGQVSFDFLAVVSIVYEPFVPIPEPGTAGLVFAAVLVIPVAQAALRRRVH